MALAVSRPSSGDAVQQAIATSVRASQELASLGLGKAHISGLVTGSQHIYERYADSDAAVVHLGNFGAKFAERFLQCFEPTDLYVYGEPSDEARAALDGFGAVYLGTFGGFSR